jgi:restriction endonuclease Mrr
MVVLTRLPFEQLTTKDQRELQELVGLRMAINDRSQIFLERVREKIQAKVAAEHEAAKAAVRDQEQVVQTHRDEIVLMTQKLNTLRELEADACNALP